MPDEYIQEINNKITRKAKELGFLMVGFSKVSRMEKEASFLKKWLAGGKQGKMDYLAKHFEKRVDPEKLVENAKSIISLAHNYYPEENQNPDSPYKISKYAYGRDYHKVLKKKLKKLFYYIKELKPETEGRYFVDSAPVLERQWGQRSGLGWIGKNTMLIHPEHGSWFFLSEIILNLELGSSEAMSDHCGNCVACLKACPTGALNIQKPYEIDASSCISYHTIENDQPGKEALDGNNKWIFGCDICQEVCPWTRKSQPNRETDFHIKDFIKTATAEDWEKLSETDFDKHFSGSAIKRAKYPGLKRNIELVKNS